MKIIVTSVVFFFISFTVLGKVQIKGCLINLKITKNVFHYNKPIDGFANIVLGDEPLKFINDSTFIIETSLKQSGYIFIWAPEKLIQVFINPNDSFHINIYYGKNITDNKVYIKTIKFTGNNAAGREDFCLNEEYRIQQNYLNNTIFSKAYSNIEDLFESGKSALHKLLSPFDSLYALHKIDKDFYALTTNDIKSTFGYQLFNLFEYYCKTRDAHLTDNERNKLVITIMRLNYSLFKKEEFDSLKSMCYRFIDPLNELNSYSFLGGGYYLYYCKDLYKGLMRSDLKFDSSFLHLDSTYQPLGFLTDRFLERTWASMIYMDSRIKNSQIVESNYKRFISHFSHSAYLPYLKQIIGRIKKDDDLDNSVKKDIEFVNPKKYTSFRDLLNDKFHGEFVFVDLWASWCTPCVQELVYKNKLQELLNKKNIKLLYISLDDETTVERCRSIIDSKKLYGYHVVDSKEIAKDLTNIIYGNNTIAIPRYFLIDKNGNIIDANLPRPDNITALGNRLSKLIEE